MTQCSTDEIKFKLLGMRFDVADFNGGTITSDAGVLLLDKTEQAIALLERAAECFADHRDGDLIEQTGSDFTRFVAEGADNASVPVPNPVGERGFCTPAYRQPISCTAQPLFRPIRRNQNRNSSPGEKCGLGRGKKGIGGFCGQNNLTAVIR